MLKTPSYAEEADLIKSTMKSDALFLKTTMVGLTSIRNKTTDERALGDIINHTVAYNTSDHAIRYHYFGITMQCLWITAAVYISMKYVLHPLHADTHHKMQRQHSMKSRETVVDQHGHAQILSTPEVNEQLSNSRQARSRACRSLDSPITATMVTTTPRIDTDDAENKIRLLNRDLPGTPDLS